ncbi:hypothetical protein [Glutamicibacter sp. MNS18]
MLGIFLRFSSSITGNSVICTTTLGS